MTLYLIINENTGIVMVKNRDILQELSTGDCSFPIQTNLKRTSVEIDLLVLHSDFTNQFYISYIQSIFDLFNVNG
jgi:hypothetical protein